METRERIDKVGRVCTENGRILRRQRLDYTRHVTFAPPGRVYSATVYKVILVVPSVLPSV